VLKTKRNTTAHGKFSSSCDMRIEQCSECGLIQRTESRRALIEVFDADQLKKKLVTPEEYNAVWRPKDMILRSQIPLFDHD
jgi:hypothetical protein